MCEDERRLPWKLQTALQGWQQRLLTDVERATLLRWHRESLHILLSEEDQTTTGGHMQLEDHTLRCPCPVHGPVTSIVKLKMGQHCPERNSSRPHYHCKCWPGCQLGVSHTPLPFNCGHTASPELEKMFNSDVRLPAQWYQRFPHIRQHCHAQIHGANCESFVHLQKDACPRIADS